MSNPSSAMDRPGRVLILGAGGHARVIAEMVERQHGSVLAGFLDDALAGGEVHGLPVLGRLADLGQVLTQMGGAGLIVGIGDNAARRRVVQEVGPILESLGGRFVSAIDPSAVISPRATVGPGTVVMAHVTVNAGTVVGAHAILNTTCSADHDCRIADFTHISPGTHLAGTVMIGEGTHVGIGCAVIPRIRIGAWSVVGAGSAVVRDVPDRVVAYGVPARVMRHL